MILKNFKSALKMWSSGKTIPNGFKIVQGNLYDCELGIASGYNGALLSDCGDYTTNSLPNDSSRHMFLWLGSGNTEPTEDDYTLESPIDLDNNLIHSNKYFMSDNKDDKGIVYITHTVINPTNEDVSIQELGLVRRVRTYSTSSSTWVNVLLTRDVLEKPITIKPNSSYSFTIGVNLTD